MTKTTETPRERSTSKPDTVRDTSHNERRCIEWTGAGGDYYLAVVVEDDRVISEHWGTRADILAWMNERWPRLPRRFVPMVFSPAPKQVQKAAGSRSGATRTKRRPA